MASSGLLFCSSCSKLHSVVLTCNACCDVTYCGPTCTKRDSASHRKVCRGLNEPPRVSPEERQDASGALISAAAWGPAVTDCSACVGARGGKLSTSSKVKLGRYAEHSSQSCYTRSSDGSIWNIVVVDPHPANRAKLAALSAFRLLAAHARPQQLNGPFTPILHTWGVSSVPCPTREEEGGLVLADEAMQRFWLLEPCPGAGVSPHAFDVVAALAQAHADTLWSLLRYLGFEPRFVRFCVCGPDKSCLPLDLCHRGADGTEPEPTRLHCTVGAYGEVCAGQCAPSISRECLHQVDATVAAATAEGAAAIAGLRARAYAAGNAEVSALSSQRVGSDGSVPPGVEASAPPGEGCALLSATGAAVSAKGVEALAGGPESIEASLQEWLLARACRRSPPAASGREGAPSWHEELLRSHSSGFVCRASRCAAREIRACLNTPADAEDEDDGSAPGQGLNALLACGRCRLKFYCSAACQRAHWRGGHRSQCRAPEAVGMASAPAGVARVPWLGVETAPPTTLVVRPLYPGR